MTTILGLVAVLGVAVLLLAREGQAGRALGSITVFVGASILYYVAVPLELLLRGTEHWNLGSIVGTLSPTEAGVVFLLASSAMAGFALGFQLGGGDPVEIYQVDPIAPGVSVPRVGVQLFAILAGLSFIVLVGWYSGSLVRSGSYAGNVATAASSPLYSYLIGLWSLSTGTLAAVLLQSAGRRLVVGILLVAGLVGWGLYSSNKDPLVIGGFATLAGLGPSRLSRVRARTLVGMLFALPLVGLAAIGFSLFRAGVPLALLVQLAGHGLFVHTDPAGPLYSITESLRAHESLRWGASYVEATVQWVPQVLWPGRPIDLAQEFAMAHLSSWAPGQGLGYSPMAEAISNFGLSGPFIVFSGLGVLWAIVWRFLLPWLFGGDMSARRSFYVVCGLYLLFLVHRGPFSGMVTHVVQLIAPIAVVSILVRFPGLPPRAGMREVMP